MCHVSLQVTRPELNPQEDVRETIFFAFAENRMPILSMSPLRASLEEVFLELTEGSSTQEMEEEANESNL